MLGSHLHPRNGQAFLGSVFSSQLITDLIVFTEILNR